METMQMDWIIEELNKVSKLEPKLVGEAFREFLKQNKSIHRMIVINAYLDGKINLSKAAEELGITREELETQLRKEGIPLRTLSKEDVKAEAEAIRQW